MFNFFKKKLPSEDESIRYLIDLASTARLQPIRDKGIVFAIMVLIDRTGSELVPYTQYRRGIAEFIGRIEERIESELPESRANEFAELGIPLEVLADKSDELSTAERLLGDSQLTGCLKWHLDHEKNIIIDPL